MAMKINTASGLMILNAVTLQIADTWSLILRRLNCRETTIRELSGCRDLSGVSLLKLHCVALPGNGSLWMARKSLLIKITLRPLRDGEGRGRGRWLERATNVCGPVAVHHSCPVTTTTANDSDTCCVPIYFFNLLMNSSTKRSNIRFITVPSSL